MRTAALQHLLSYTFTAHSRCAQAQVISSLFATSACRPQDSLFASESARRRARAPSSTPADFANTGAEGVVQPRIKALLVDAAGTLISPSEPAAAVYLRYAKPYGCSLTEEEILQNFRRAFNEPWTRTALRYQGEGREFWRHVVGQATGCADETMHEAIYDYFGTAEAWAVAPEAGEALKELREAGIRLAVISNFDTRLRPLLEALGLAEHFDALLVSAEVGAEKPNPVIFEAACAALGVRPGETLVLGDDRRNDISGGRDAGCSAWLYGVDVKDFRDASRRLLSGRIF